MLNALVVQLGVIVLSALLAWLIAAVAWQPWLYGGLAAWVGAGLLVWRWHRGRRDYHSDAARHLGSFHRSMMERFFVVGVMLAAGFVHAGRAPGFDPLVMLLGFIVGQLAWLIALALANRH